MTQALSLEAAYDALGRFPVAPGTAHASFYVPQRATYRKEHALDDLAKLERELRRSVRAPERARKLLFSGHTGSGKSSELLRLADDLGEIAEVVHVRTERAMNFSDVDARDVLYVILAAVADRIQHYEGLERYLADPELKTALEMLRARLPDSLRVESGEVSLFQMIRLRFQTDNRVRAELRKAAEAAQDTLVEVLDRAVTLLAGFMERPVVLMVDELDKLRPDRDDSLRLFREDFRLLLRPQATILFTLPLEVHYDDRFVDVFRQEDDRFVLGHIKLWEAAGSSSRYAPGWEVMREFVRRRMDPDLVEVASLDRAIELSGGSFDQLRRLLRAAVDHADYVGAEQVGAASLAHAERSVRTDLERLYGAARHVNALRRVHEQQMPEFPGDLRYVPLLAILEHQNEKQWWDVNPVLRSLIEPNSTTD